MNWEQLKEKVYYCDGSLRDIYVKGTTKEDWKIWVDFLNKNYTVTFLAYETETVVNKIDINQVIDYWDGIYDNGFAASIFIHHICINIYFFRDGEIENDILPSEITSVEDHIQLTNYMTEISKILNKRVIMTPENTPEMVLISADNDKLLFFPE